MSDFEDDSEDLDESGIRDALTRRMRTEGARVAFDTALSICKDPKASSAAKASAVNSLLRAGGFFNNFGGDDGGKDLSQMTPDEVDAALRKATAALARRETGKNTPPGSLFD
ncbi:hypothetical protein [Bradyrhizobium sp. URHD0069]|uniref:hypothetical protein n=1 Tax=Bradyrhizobium sp. URHD0069 TaxID=1380355 RepID=UPI00049556C0|nr:hypothetical protein [Bradyrhizobium sp. URHD0069]